MQMWKDLFHSVVAIPEGIEVVFPASGRRVPRLVHR
jgi:hypothetical protein